MASAKGTPSTKTNAVTGAPERLNSQDYATGGFKAKRGTFAESRKAQEAAKAGIKNTYSMGKVQKGTYNTGGLKATKKRSTKKAGKKS